MTGFPRTTVGGVSLSRMIIGSNWFMGYSHATDAKDKLITSSMDRRKIADVIEVFLSAGVDTIMGCIQLALLNESVKEAQDRTGKRLIVVSTPGVPTGADTPAKGIDIAAAAKVLDAEAKLGTAICMPHQMTTDNLVDRCTHRIRHIRSAIRGQNHVGD